jgi:hypothetical protein
MSDTELTQLHGVVLEALDLVSIAHEDEYDISVKGQDFQLDCFLPDFYACVEVDGKYSHGMRGRKDRARDALLLSAGIPTLRLRQKVIDSEKVEGVARLINLWLASITGDIGERRKGGKKDAMWD